MYTRTALVFATCFIVFVSGSSINELHIKTLDTGATNVWSNSDIYSMNTKLSDYEYPELTEATHDFIFKVKAASDAYVLLSQAYDLVTPNFIEVVLGGNENQVSHVWYWSPSGHLNYPPATNTLGLLSNNEYREFNISWREGDRLMITDGGGTVWVDVWAPVNISVKGIGLRSGWGYDAEWIIPLTVRFTGHYLEQPSLAANMSISNIIPGTSIFRCASRCNMHTFCLGFNYFYQDGECQLVSGNQLIVLNEANGWSWFAKCLLNKSMCL